MCQSKKEPDQEAEAESDQWRASLGKFKMYTTSSKIDVTLDSETYTKNLKKTNKTNKGDVHGPDMETWLGVEPVLSYLNTPPLPWANLEFKKKHIITYSNTYVEIGSSVHHMKIRYQSYMLLLPSFV